MEIRQRLVRRLDMLFFTGLLITSGLAAVLFSYQYYADDSEEKATMVPATVAVLPTQSATNTLTATATRTPTPTVTHTPTLTLTATRQLAPPVVSPLAVDEIQVGEPLTFMGSGESGATIILYDGDEIISETSAGSNGGWSITLPDGLDEGPHELSIQAIRPDGSSSQQVPVGFEVSSVPSLTFTPPPTRTSTPTRTPTITPSLTRTATQRPTLTPTLTVTIAPTNTLHPTITPSPTWTATQRPTQTLIPTFTATFVPTNTAQPALTETSTAFFPPTSSPIPPSQTPILSPTESGQDGGVAAGQIPSLTPVILLTEVSVAVRPHIDAPASGEIVAPGSIRVRGTGLPGAIVEIINQGAGTTLAAVPIAPDGTWEISIMLQGAGKETLVAAMITADRTRLLSDPVQITLAPPVQPQTGSNLKGNLNETGRTFTALLALLLAAGGFSAYFAGRLLYLVAHDRLKPR